MEVEASPQPHQQEEVQPPPPPPAEQEGGMSAAPVHHHSCSSSQEAASPPPPPDDEHKGEEQSTSSTSSSTVFLPAASMTLPDCNIIINFGLMNQFIKAMKCPACLNGNFDLNPSNCTKIGMAYTLTYVCTNLQCQAKHVLHTSRDAWPKKKKKKKAERHQGPVEWLHVGDHGGTTMNKEGNPLFFRRRQRPLINFLVVNAIRKIGFGYSALEKALFLLDLPRFFSSTYYEYSAIIDAADCSMAEKVYDENIEIVKAKARAAGKEPDPETKVLEVHAVSMDGSWNKRGRTSNFGHVTAFDCDTGLALASGHRSKVCGICDEAKNKGREADPGHKCRKNWENSSGSMEPDIVVEIVKKLWEKGIKIAHYVGDNDTAVMHAIKHELDPKIGGDMVKMTDPNHQFGNFRDRLDSKVRPYFKKALTVRNMDHMKNLYEKNVYAFPGQPERMRECMLNMINHLFDLDHSACNTFNHIKCAKASDPSHMTSNLSYGKYLDPNLKAMVPIPKKKAASKASGNKEHQVPAYKEVTFLEAVREVIEEFSELEVLKRLANPNLSSQINEALHSVNVRNSSPKFMPYEKTVEPRYEAAVLHFSKGVFKTHLEFRRFLGLGKKQRGANVHGYDASIFCLL
jgi:hypothetical protein